MKKYAAKPIAFPAGLMVWIVLLVAGLSVPARATLIVSDDFTYPNGNFTTSYNGGVSFDANNAWIDPWAYTGGSLGGTNTWRVLNNAAYAVTNLPTLISAYYVTRHFVEDKPAGTTMYFSFILDWQNDVDDDYEVMLEFTTAGFALFRAGLKDDAYLIEQGFNGGAGSLSTASYNGNPGRRRLVGRVEFNVEATVDERFTLWIDPVSESNAPALQVLGNTFRSDLLGEVRLFRNGSIGNRIFVDDLKIGTDFNFVLPADPAVCKSVTPDVLTGASNLTYTLIVTNQVQALASGVVLVDLLPTGVVFGSSVPVPDSVAGQEIGYLIGDMPGRSSVTITMQAYADPAIAAAYTNRLQIVFSSSPDLDLSNNFAEAITYVPGLSLPFVDNADGATNIQVVAATLNGTLVQTGASVTAISVYWGTNDGGTAKGDWGHEESFGPNAAWPPVAYARTVTSLTENTLYYYRYYASNTAGEVWAATTTTFRTESLPGVNNGIGISGRWIGTAILNGALTNGAGSDAWFYWGLTDGGTNPADWDLSANLGPKPLGAFSLSISNLLYGAVYYYRAYVTNEFGANWATNSFAFTTLLPIRFGLENGPATALTQTSIVLRAELDIPEAIMDLTLYWGDNNGGMSPAAWDHVVPLGRFTNLVEVLVSNRVSGLLANTEYFYSFRGRNLWENEWTTPDTFIAAVSPGAFDYRSQITFCGYTPPVAESLVNFPVLVSISPANITGFNYAQCASLDGYDLRFFDAAGSRELSYEIETWNPAGTSYVWVQVPELADNTTMIYAYWGNTNALIQPSYARDGSTWSEKFVGVWHFKETGSDDRLDSTANRYDAVPKSYDGDEKTTGIVGDCDWLNRSGTANDYLAIRDLAYTQPGEIEQITVETWERINSSGGWDILIGFDRDHAWRLALEDFVGNDDLGWDTHDETGLTHDLTPAPDYTDGNWHFIAATFNAGDAVDKKLYADNGLLASASAHGGSRLGSGTTRYGTIGADSRSSTFDGPIQATSEMNGRIDEFRISSVARSESWLWATWRTIADNGGFTCYGVAESQAPSDLTLSKVVSFQDLLEGTSVVYTITVTNKGPFSALNVNVTDVLPPELAFSGSTPAPSFRQDPTNVFNFPSLAAGAGVTITIETAVVSPVPAFITNRAHVVSSGAEVDPADNIGLAVVAVPDSDLDGVNNPLDPNDDNDPYTDEDEAIAGTDPLDPDSYLWLRSFHTTNTSVQTLTFPSELLHWYRIQSATNLFDGVWTDSITNIFGNGTLRLIDATNLTERGLYYRIGVENSE